MGEQQVVVDAGQKQKSKAGCIENWAALWEQECLPSVRSVTEEIPPGQWESFFKTFTYHHQHWPVTIEQVGPDMGYRMQAGNRPLFSIAARPGNQVNALLISLGSAKLSGGPGCLAVSGATHIWLKRNEKGVDEALEIEATDGTLTILHLLPPNAMKEAKMITFTPFPRFRDRTDAGQRLASRLKAYADRPDVVELALPRGGVPVAVEIARELNAPLDIFMVRKLGVPGYGEYALGAIASGGLRVINDHVVHSLGIPSSVVNDLAAKELHEIERREQLYRGGHLPLEIAGQIAIIVDDGMATGSSMRAAITALRLHQPARIVIAVPVAPSAACEELRAHVDELVCLVEPTSFIAVGQWYEDFRQINDYDVHDILAKASAALDPVKV